MLTLPLVLLIIGFVFSMVMAFNLGANDAANPTSVAVGSGVLTIKRALLLFAIFVIAGALLQGFTVIKTVGKGVVPEIEIVGAFSAVVVASLWIFFSSWKGWPISTTHAIVGAITGFGIAKYGIWGINLGILSKIMLSWVTSPIAAALLSALIYKILVSMYKRYGPKKLERVLPYLVVFSVVFSAYSFGMNDVANATGVYVTIATKLGRIPDETAMLLLAAIAVVGIIAGGMTIGPRVINTVAYKITTLDLAMGFASGLSNASVVYLFSVIPYYIFGYGMPISTTYAAVGAIIGAGLAKGKKHLDLKLVSKLFFMWILTLIVTMIGTMAVYTVLSPFVA
jgi:PiT family inorganic phosphate transporter